MVGKITGMVVQKRNKERVNVYLDGEFAFGLAMIEALKLHKGQSLSDGEVERLRALDEVEVAHEAALRFLAHRPRSIAEVRQKLGQKELSPEAIEQAIQRLQDTRLLDDEAFARFWVDNREQFGPRSSRALKSELRRKGVAEDDIRASLEGMDEEAAAYRAANAQARRHQGQDRQVFMKRLGDFLLRRGFNYSVVKQVVNRLWNEHIATEMVDTDGNLPVPDTDLGE
jgi:regulatory protein